MAHPHPRGRRPLAGGLKGGPGTRRRAERRGARFAGSLVHAGIASLGWSASSLVLSRSALRCLLSSWQLETETGLPR
ncbi:hypothetical protein BO71DRAFT_147549 [Aspergillus ellipticus CBS 707.79]|uniref:Uncharacterized protein n=1 Tax=Aspergillus ellipticus CBS 707.79 TaxID=1448320 RepID=A0A319EAP8_9EURO|nr:hypothetical protein BO71DRAFT_147549 [Aspergillus ellipticus CBS 707.79]